MNNYNYIKTQEQYDNQIPQRYNEKPVTVCNECGIEIYKGEEYYKGNYDICCDCYECNHDFYLCIAREEDDYYE